MADVVGNRKPVAARLGPSRLQRRAPASIQITPVTEWNVVIPLLSPLVQSPTLDFEPTVEINSVRIRESSAVEAVVMKKWQHPAVPFCYEPAPFRPFVCL